MKPSSGSEKFLGYYSEPDAKYIEIDYEFLKQLRKLAELNLKYRSPGGRRRRESSRRYSSSNKEKTYNPVYEKLVDTSNSYRPCRDRSTSSHSSRDSHCDICCTVCQSQKKKEDFRKNRSPTTSISSRQDVAKRKNRSRSIDWYSQSSSCRRGSAHSTKSVSFIQDIVIPHSPHSKKHFFSDSKVSDRRAGSSKLSLKDKFLTGLRYSFDDREKKYKKTPMVKNVRGLWKSF